MIEMDHRGRFQAQGGELGKEGVSEPWADPEPLQALTGHILLTGLSNKIHPRSAAPRQGAFREAHRFIDNCQAGGGVGSGTKKSFYVRGHRDASRVDVEVQKGLAFV